MLRSWHSAVIIGACLQDSLACTGIGLSAKDGTVLAARTDEWTGNDLLSTVLVFPKHHEFHSTLTMEELFNPCVPPTGMKWNGKFGFVSIGANNMTAGPDGMNEKGLYAGMYYFPQLASLAEPSKDDEDKHYEVSAGDWMQWILSTKKTVAEVKESLKEDVPRIVALDEPGLNVFHWKFQDDTGDCMILEITDHGRRKNTYDCVQGVITNSPEYSWHLSNLHEYLKLSPEVPQTRTFSGNYANNHYGTQVGKPYGPAAPWGSGSGMIGIPGDFTPTARFVRALMYVETVIALETAADAVTEAFRILSNFDIPLGSVHGRDHLMEMDKKFHKTRMPSQDLPIGATQITTCADVTNRKYYWHTMYNRRVQAIDLKKIAWGDFDTVRVYHLDPDKHQDVAEWNERGRVAGKDFSFDSGRLQRKSSATNELESKFELPPSQTVSKFEVSTSIQGASHGNDRFPSIMSYMVIAQTITMFGTMATAVLFYRRAGVISSGIPCDREEGSE